MLISDSLSWLKVFLKELKVKNLEKFLKLKS
jgi:hypothetical protein